MRRFLPVFLFSFLFAITGFSYLEAQPLHAQLYQTRTIGGEEEKQAIADAINKFLDPAGIKIGELSLSDGESGGKVASGKVSFFGFDNIELKAEIQSTKKIKSIAATFPEAASINAEKLGKFLSGKSLSQFLPKSFPLQTGISLKDFNLSFDEKGDSLEQFNINFGIGEYKLEGFDGFAIDGVSVGFVLDKPTSPQHKATATISGDGKIGAMPINLSANMSSDPDDLLFSFTASNISIPNLLKAFLSDNRANSLLRFIPSSIQSKEISSVTASINPTTKNFSALASTSFGEAEIQFTAATEESKSLMLFALAPPAGFKFSSLSQTLAPMDGIDLSGSALIISTMAEEDAKCNLAALKDEGEIKVEEGVNLLSSIKLSEDLAKLLKVNAIKLRGTCNETFTNMSMNAALDLNIPMGSSITMKEVVFGLRLGTVNPIELSLGGRIEAQVGKDLLGFNASFAFAPVDQKINGEFFMAALRKENGAMQSGKLGPDGKSDLPEWTNPFGIPGVGLRKIGVSAGIDFKNPILISSIGLTGAARLGTVSNRNKHIEGDATIVVDITKPTNSLIDITMKNMTILAMIEAFVENASIQGQLRTMLNTGIDQARVLVVPVDGMQAFGKTYNKGVSVSGQLSIAGIKANGDFSLNESGVSGAGSMDPINWGNGIFVLGGRTTDRPQFRFAYTKGSMPSMFVDGKVSLLGISSETTLNLDDKGFEFTTTGKIADMFEATLEAKGQSLGSSGGGIAVRAVLRNDIISRLNQLVTSAIDEQISSVKNSIKATRDKLKTATDNLAAVDKEIFDARRLVASDREAFNLQMLEEKRTALKKQQDLVKTCMENNASSQAKLNGLDGYNPLHWPEISMYKSAIAANDATIKVATPLITEYGNAVAALGKLPQEFSVDLDPRVSTLILKRQTLQGLYYLAEKGLDVVEGVSVGTLEATKFVMDNVLGGLFDIKSAEFAGVFGLNSEYKANVAFNFTLAKKPYHFTVGIDFKNLGESAKTIAKDIVTGNILKSGFSKSFADELKKPVTAYRFASETKSVATATPPPAVYYSYLITMEPTMAADAASAERFGVVLTGDQGSTELLPLTQFGVMQPGKRSTFQLQTEKQLGTINHIRIQALNPGITDNLKLNTVGVMPPTGNGAFSSCINCVIQAGQTAVNLPLSAGKMVKYKFTLYGLDKMQVMRATTATLIGVTGKSAPITISQYPNQPDAFWSMKREMSLTIPDIGPVQAVQFGNGTADAWILNGMHVENPDGSLMYGFVNKPITYNLMMSLEPPSGFKDYTIDIYTKSGSPSFSTTENVEMSMNGGKLQVHAFPLKGVMRSGNNQVGDNIFQSGNRDHGVFTAFDLGPLTSISLFSEGRFADDWQVDRIVISTYEKGQLKSYTFANISLSNLPVGRQITVPVQTAADWVNKELRIENTGFPGYALNVETGTLLAGPIGDGAWSALWTLKKVPGTEYYWIENKWKTGWRMHMEAGPLTAAVIPDGAWSAHWIIQPAPGGGYYIENRYRTGSKIFLTGGKLMASIPSAADMGGAGWMMREVK